MYDGPDKRRLSSLQSAVGTFASGVYWVDWQAQSSSSVYFTMPLIPSVFSYPKEVAYMNGDSLSNRVFHRGV